MRWRIVPRNNNLITTMKSGDDQLLISYDGAGNIRETTISFYQATSEENAKKIIAEKRVNLGEFSRVYAWRRKPTFEEVASSGARSFDRLVSFKVHCNVFDKDNTVIKELRDIACISTRPRPIEIEDPKIIDFK